MSSARAGIHVLPLRTYLAVFGALLALTAVTVTVAFFDLGVLNTFTAVTIAGLPPLSGFVGKLLVLQAAGTAPGAVVIWSVLLGAALLVIVAVARAGSALFWRTAAGAPGAPVPALDGRSVGAIVGLLACVVGLVAWGGAATSYAWSTARQLADPSGYVAAVLGSDASAHERRRSLR